MFEMIDFPKSLCVSSPRISVGGEDSEPIERSPDAPPKIHVMRQERPTWQSRLNSTRPRGLLGLGSFGGPRQV